MSRLGLPINASDFWGVEIELVNAGRLVFTGVRPRRSSVFGRYPVYFPISTRVNVLGTGLGRGFGFSAVGGTGSFLSVPREDGTGARLGSQFQAS